MSTEIRVGDRVRVAREVPCSFWSSWHADRIGKEFEVLEIDCDGDLLVDERNGYFPPDALDLVEKRRRTISLTLAADTTDKECGNCPCVTLLEQCGAFERKDLDNDEDGTFLRLPECIAAEVSP